MHDIILGIFLTVFNSFLLYFNFKDGNHFGSTISIVALIVSVVLIHIGLAHNV